MLLSKLGLGPLLVAALVGTTACSDDKPPVTVEEIDESVIPQVPVPPADGPKLVAIQHRLVVWDRPSKNQGKPLGYLRAGAQVARATEAYTRQGCEGGWYPVRPRGFVCAGPEATIDMEHPAAKVLPGPALERALPYRYGRATRDSAVAYRAIPDWDQQVAAEPQLRHGMPTTKPTKIGTGANDVPLDEHGRPKGVPVLLPDAEGVGGDGYRTTDTYFAYPGIQAAPPPLGVGKGIGSTAPETEVLKPKSGVPIVSSFVTGEGEHARRFGITADGRFVPTDHLDPTPAAAYHGLAVDLPVCFAIRQGLQPRQLELQPDDTNIETILEDEFETHQPIGLTGRYRTVKKDRYYYTRADNWVRRRDCIMVHKRHEWPDFVGKNTKWIDISLARQTLTAFEGQTAVYVTMIASGKDRLGDPTTGPSTIQGQFSLIAKHVSKDLDSKEVQQEFSVLDAPWVLEFAEGFAITGSYWQNYFGMGRNYHAITLAPIDAHWLWQWTDPQLPEGWHGAVIGEDDPNTYVFIHK